jgi:glycosyltransferase 2 family protein
MRKFVFAVFLMLAVVFILARAAEVSSILETIKQADWRFIVLAMVVMGLWLGNNALDFWAVYRAMDMEEKLGHLALQFAAANFVNVVAPSAGMGGIAVFISEAKRKGFSRARVTVAGGVVVLLDYIGFLIMLALGLVVLIRRSTLSNTELVASAIMVVMAVVLGSLLYTGMRSATAFGNTLVLMARQVNRVLWPFLHREYIPEYRVHEFAHEASGGLYRLRHQPKSLLLPAALAFNGKLLLTLIFLLIFLAYKVPFSPGTIVAGWSISYLFTIVSPTPAGIGLVEGILPLTLTTLNVSLGAATVITLTYRGITFWVPLFLGMLAFRWLVREEKVQALA